MHLNIDRNVYIRNAYRLTHEMRNIFVWDWGEWQFDKIGLVSFFNGVSTFLGYIIPKVSLSKNSSNISAIERCPWCNGYHRRKWTRRHEFKSWTRMTAFHIELIPLGKVWIQLFSLQLWLNSWADWFLPP